MKKVVVNLSNLHVGGGVQVGASFVYELAYMQDIAPRLVVIASTEVDQSLENLNCRREVFLEYHVIDIYGLNIGRRGIGSIVNNSDVVFTVFGPLYTLFRSYKSVVGFAQAWIIYPQNAAVHTLSWSRRVILSLKYRLQSFFFRQADELIVELPHVKEGLKEVLGIKEEKITIVPNCLSAIYQDKVLWRDVNIPSVRCDISFGFVGRNYIHKNVQFFADVAVILERRYGLVAKIYVTFTDSEWYACSEHFKACAVNVGPISVDQCPKFYESVDAVFFPSLVECFSATPLEALAMRKPLFASDMDFNRDVCADFAYYFDPLDAIQTAEVVASFVAGDRPELEWLERGAAHAYSFGSAKSRALMYASIILN